MHLLQNGILMSNELQNLRKNSEKQKQIFFLEHIKFNFRYSTNGFMLMLRNLHICDVSQNCRIQYFRWPRDLFLIQRLFVNGIDNAKYKHENSHGDILFTIQDQNENVSRYLFQRIQIHQIVSITYTMKLPYLCLIIYFQL